MILVSLHDVLGEERVSAHNKLCDFMGKKHGLAPTDTRIYKSYMSATEGTPLAYRVANRPTELRDIVWRYALGSEDASHAAAGKAAQAINAAIGSIKDFPASGDGAQDNLAYVTKAVDVKGRPLKDVRYVKIEAPTYARLMDAYQAMPALFKSALEKGLSESLQR